MNISLILKRVKVFLSYKTISLFKFLFHIWPETQSASVLSSGARPPFLIGRTLISLVDVTGKQMLPPHGDEMEMAAPLKSAWLIYYLLLVPRSLDLRPNLK